MMSQIMVTGASGDIGRKTLLHLLKLKKPASQLAGLVRDPDKAKDLAALGGRTALSNLRSRSMKGTITGSTPVGDLTGPVEILNEVPNKSRTFVQLDLSGLGLGKFVQDQRFDGTSGYVIDTMQGNRDIAGEQLDAMKNAQFPSPLLNYKGMGTTVELAGKERSAIVMHMSSLVNRKPALLCVITSTRRLIFRSEV